MPLFYTVQVQPNVVLGIWQIDESVEELRAMLPSFLQSSEIKATHPKRLQEWLASRVLLYQLLPTFTHEPLELQRNEHGKPYFAGDKIHVSITHSPSLAAVLLSDKFEVGIDIELISEKALRVAKRFLSEDEIQQTGSDALNTCLYWSAKETLYKIYSRKQLVLKDEISLWPSLESKMLKGQVKKDNFNKLYQIHYDTFSEHVLTYCIDK